MKIVDRMMLRLALLSSMFVFAVSASAQVGGSIIGTVSDQTGGVLPGVTVTVAGPALMGTRSDVTDGEGKYRLPALPPGRDYIVTFELSGFAPVKREGIRLDVGFTATIDRTLEPGAIVETVTVSGASPVVDATASKVTTHLDAEQLTRTLVGSRDYSAVMAQIPAVLQPRVDVGGSNATTMQTYRAYGLANGRGEIEGINSSQFGSGGLLGYSDMEAFDDLAVTVVGNGADMAQPGTFVNAVSKSGGNSYHGQSYIDFQDKTMGTTNIDDALIGRGLQGNAIVPVYDLNKFNRFRDVSANLGGFIKKDKLWWFGGLRHTLSTRAVPILLDDIQTTTLLSTTVKGTYNATPNNKFTAFYTNTDNVNRNYGVDANSTTIVTSDALTDEIYPNGTYSFSYESLMGRSAILSLRAGHWGDFGNYRGKGDKQRYTDSGLNRNYGTISTRLDHRDRPQMNGSLTYFKDGWAGSHSFKVGGEFQHEQQKYQTTSIPNNMVLFLNNNVPTFVDVYLVPISTRVVGRNLGLYANDAWRFNNRLTLNLGLRFDRYRNYVPAQTGPQGHDFAQIEGPEWNDWAPRVGFVYSLSEDGKTLLKVSSGLFWENPGFTIASQFNPNPNTNTIRYNWINPNPTYGADGLPIFEGPQQLGSIVSITGARPDFSPAVTTDPNLKNQYTPQASAFFEKEVAANFGIRTGFVWNGIRNPRAVVNVNWPFSAYNQPVSIQNPGPDGRPGTTDDGAAITAFNLDPAAIALPVVQQIRNGILRNSDYYTWEATATKRLSNRWSLLATYSKLWSREGATILSPNELINTTDGRDYFSEWQVRLSSTLQLPKGIELSPIYRGQAGRPFAPTFLARLNYSSAVSIKAAPRGQQGTDAVNVFDIRAQRVFAFGQTKLRGFIDVYNLTNSNAVQQETTSYGANYLRPALISGPRVARVGLRFEF